MNKLNIELKLHEIETKLNDWSCLPVIGAVPALAKSALGVIQLTSAIAVAIFTAIPAAFGNEKAKDLFLYSWTHVKHGVANICSGLIQILPFVSLLRYCGGYDCSLQLEDNQPYKFMSYPTLAMEGHLTFDRGINGYSSMVIEGEFNNLLDKMPAKEAFKLGLINEKCEAVDGAYEKVRDDYLSNKIPLRGQFKKERDEEIEKFQRERDEEIEKSRKERENKPLYKIRAGMGGRHKKNR